MSFDPPLISMAQSPDAFRFQWNLMHSAFQLPNPSDFPPLALTREDDLASLARYVATAKQLAATSVLSANESTTIKVTNTPAGQVESVETRFSPHDSTVGFSTIFRQLFANSEPASFSSARNVISRANHEQSGPDSDGRRLILEAWRSAHADLLNVPVKQIAISRHLGNSGAIRRDGQKSPREIIEIFNYGDLIHWGKHSSTHSSLVDTEAHAALSRMDFLEAVVGLSHLYLGFSVIVDRVLTASEAT